jgi:hypothetical protein
MWNFVSAFGRAILARLIVVYYVTAVLIGGGGLLLVGTKIYQQTTYVPVDARVLARSVLCEMSYATGRHSRTERIVPCAQVASVKAKLPEIDWAVRQVDFASIAYLIGREERVVTVGLGDLGGRNVVVGQTIAILHSPDDPQKVTTPITLGTILLGAILFVVGLTALIGPTTIRRWRRRRSLQASASSAQAFAGSGKNIPSKPREPTVTSMR